MRKSINEQTRHRDLETDEGDNVKIRNVKLYFQSGVGGRKRVDNSNIPKKSEEDVHPLIQSPVIVRNSLDEHSPPWDLETDEGDNLNIPNVNLSFQSPVVGRNLLDNSNIPYNSEEDVDPFTLSPVIVRNFLVEHSRYLSLILIF